MLQGFDLCDSGWYATFYQNIFSNPDSVESNFLFWFTGIVGGLFVKVFPASGLLGIRLLGVLNILAIVYLVYRLLKNHISNFALFLGLILVTISFVGGPSEFFHNNLSSLLFIGASLALFKGLEQNNPYLIAVSGILVAFNIFTRLPNVLDTGLISIIIIYTVYVREKKIKCIVRILIFLSSVSISMIGILSLMKILGHYDIYINSINGLRDIASGNTGSTHGLNSLIRTNIIVYRNVILHGSVTTMAMLFLAYTISLYNPVKRGIIFGVLIFLNIFILGYLLWKFPLINLFYYFSAISLAWNIYAKEIRIKILSWLGLFMMLIMPLGSDYSIFNFGNYAIWLAVPFAVNFLMTEELSIGIKVNSITSKKQFCFQIDNVHLKMVLFLFSLIFVVKVLFSALNYAYFDPGCRLYKTHKINSDKTIGIFTTKERADIINNLLTGIKPFVKDNDYLIGYESLPMIHYLTSTKPFLYDSWLIRSVSASLEQKISRMNKEKKKLPLVIRQKFETIGDFGIPSVGYISDNRKSTSFVSQEQTRLFNEFLIKHGYKIIWENSHFILYKPQSDQQ
jgi:hypothetical protein